MDPVEFCPFIVVCVIRCYCGVSASEVTFCTVQYAFFVLQLLACIPFNEEGCDSR
jgi:hypothetical protein